MKKNMTPQQEFEKYIKDISSSFERWTFIKDNGCNDPSWADGVNMNLIRNHILYFKQKILDVCYENNFQIPQEYYIPTPPEVDNNYMSNLEQKDRVQRLIQFGNILVTEKPKYNEAQLSLF